MPVACGVTAYTLVCMAPPADSRLWLPVSAAIRRKSSIWRVCCFFFCGKFVRCWYLLFLQVFQAVLKRIFKKNNNKTRSGSFTLGFRVGSLPHHCFRVHSVMGREKEEFLSHHLPLALQIHQAPETSPALENEVTIFQGTLFLVTNITYTRRGASMDVYKRSGPSI